jgi:TonB-dependent vitamin B12 receptor
LITLTGPPVFGQDNPRSSSATFKDEITVTATGEEVEADDVPGPVTVITREEIESSQSDTVADLLRRLPGVTVMQQGDPGKLATVFTRGTESDQTLVLLDGVRLNSPYFGGYDWSQLPATGLERIEMVRGPYSALYGAEAIGGVVNLIPGLARQGLHSSLAAEWGSDDWQRYQGSLAWGGDKLDLFASGFQRQGRGVLDNSDFESEQWLVDMGWSLSGSSRVAVLLQDLSNETGIPLNGTTPSPLRRQWSEQTLVAVPITWQVSNQWTVQLTTATVDRSYRFRDPDDLWSPASDTEADSSEARLASHHQLGRHTISWGGEWRRDEATSRETWGVSLERQSVAVSSAYFQDAWRPSERLSVVAGVRWDDADPWGSEISPRCNLGWVFRPGWKLVVGYGQAFRQPSVGELYSIFGNPELEAERSSSYEVGLARRFSSSRLQLNLFATKLDQLIEYDFTSWSLRNIATAEIHGVELVHQLRLADRSSMSTQVTFLDTTDDTGDPLLRRPRWSGSWTISGELWQKLHGHLSVVWTGDRDDVDPVSYATVGNDGHVTADLALAWQPLARTEVTLRITNLTDKEYQEILGFPTPGRRLYAGLRWQQ